MTGVVRYACYDEKSVELCLGCDDRGECSGVPVFCILSCCAMVATVTRVLGVLGWLRWESC